MLSTPNRLMYHFSMAQTAENYIKQNIEDRPRRESKKIEHEGTTKIERSTTTVVLWKLARLNQGLKAQLRVLLDIFHPPTALVHCCTSPSVGMVMMIKTKMIDTKII